MTILLNYGADILVILASLGAMGYCMVLSRRLNRLTSFDKGLGGAIAVMSSQVDEMKAALREAKAGSDGAGKQLHDLVHQARDISTELEMMIAACHDFAEEAIAAQTTDPEISAEIPPASESHQIVEPASQEPVTEEAPVSDVTPIFGSRRAAADASQSNETVPAPLFRHRRPLAV
ncbi:DUF6468 domain-containing protein [Gymnodinialimonas ulvae]|uniref:DUF6468 domain-containing protein n=1 Tax=Gymnodinialimonas ulvae TaxID=3126504 RepID=UPI0030B58838